MGTSVKKHGCFYDARYFIIKSLNHHNIQLSIEKGIWATQIMNEPVLEEAFQNSGRVILIFSVNMSGFFQGYAQMMSSVGRRSANLWSHGNGKNSPWGRSFKVRWLKLNNLPFHKTLHLRNPWNDFKPVKISRDGQELPIDIGEALCKLIDSEIGVSILEGFKDVIPMKGNYEEPTYSIRDGEPETCESMSNFSLQGYPSFVYQNQTCDVQMSSAVTPGWSSLPESLPTATLNDDALLDMTYEEYLEAHTRVVQQLQFHVGPSWTAYDQSSKRLKDGEMSPDHKKGCGTTKKQRRCEK